MERAKATPFVSATGAPPPPAPPGGVFRGMTRHGMMYAAGIVLSKLVAIVMLPVYTRYLTPADYGILQLVTLTIEVISIAAGSRMAFGIFHFYHKADGAEDRRAVLSSALVLLTITYVAAALGACLVAPWIADAVFGSRGMNVVFIRLAAAGLAFDGLSVVPMAYMQLKTRSRLFVAVNLVKLLIQLTLNVVLLIPFGMGVLGVMISSFAANVLVGGGVAVWLLRDVGIGLRGAVVRSLVRFGVPLIGMQVATLFVTFGDRFFLNRAGGETQVGLYGLAYQFGFLLFTLGYAPFQRVWDPERFAIARRDDRDRIYARGWIYTNLVLITLAVALSLFAGDFIRLVAAPAFHPAVPLVSLILAAYLFQSWATFHNFGLLVTERTELFTLVTWISAIVALVGYLVLVPPLLAVGAGLTAVISLGTRFALSYYFSQRLFRIRYEWGPVLRLCAVALLVWGAAFLAPPVALGWSVPLHLALFGVYAAGVWRFGGLSGGEREMIVRALRQPRTALRQFRG